jgi:hypothetical protein
MDSLVHFSTEQEGARGHGADRATESQFRGRAGQGQKADLFGGAGQCAARGRSPKRSIDIDDHPRRILTLQRQVDR